MTSHSPAFASAVASMADDLLALNEKFADNFATLNPARASNATQVAGAITEASRLCAEFISDMARRFGDDGAGMDLKAFEEAVSDATKDLTGSLTLFAERLNSEREAA